VDGRAGNDSVYGEAGNDTLHGGDGDDYLFGGLGADALYGDLGSDYARYDSATTGVTVDLSGVIAGTSEALGDTFFAVEHIVGSGFSDRIYGDAGSNTLQGRVGDDYIDGRGGVDTLMGGIGNDTYIVDVTGDVVAELANEGTDLVNASGTVYAVCERGEPDAHRRGRDQRHRQHRREYAHG
jgi:hypothetical protein